MKKKIGFLMTVCFCGLVQAEEQNFQELVHRLRAIRENRGGFQEEAVLQPVTETQVENTAEKAESAENINQPQIPADAVAFNPRELTLERAIEYAVANNLGFQTSYSGIEIANRSFTKSRAGLFDPTLNLSYTRDTSNNGGPILNSGPNATISKRLSDSGNFTFGYATSETVAGMVGAGARISYSRALFGKDNAFLGSMAAIDRLTKDKQSSFYRYLDAYQALVLRVVESYLNVVKNYRQIEVSESVLNYRRELLGLTQVKYDLGVATKLDVLRVEVQVAQQEETIISTRNLYENSLDQLLNLLNYEEHAGDISLQYEPELNLRVYDVVEYEKLALANRLDLKIERNNLQKEEINLKLQEDTLTNKVQVTGSYGKSATDNTWSRAHDFEDREWSLGLSYTLPLGNRVNREELMIQKVQLQNQKRTLEDKENQVSLEVRTAIRSLEATQKSREVLEKNLERARENLKLAQLSYEKGIKSSIEVLDAQDDLLTVNKRYVDVTLDLKIAEFRLGRVCGLIGIPEQIENAVKQWGYEG
jgi:outer membrane protein TolC